MKFVKKIESSGNKGIILVSVMLTLTLLSALAAFFISIMISEFRISTSNRSGVISFYAAESGIQEAFFRVKNNQALKDNLRDGNISYTFTRDPYLTNGSSCTIEIEAISPGEAQVTATGRYNQGLYNSQRVVKAKIIMGVNPQKNWPYDLYASRKIDVFGSHVDVNGNLYAGLDFFVWGFSRADVVGNASAAGNISTWLFSQINVSGTKSSQNYPPAPAPVTMPIIDFNSANSTSLLNLADNVYSQAEFATLLANNNNLTLNGITYVTGSINNKKTNLTINGALVADGNIDIGTSFPGLFKPWPRLKIFRTAPGDVSGLISKGKIIFGLYAQQIVVNGFIYSMDEFKFSDFADSVSINGAVAANNVSLLNIFGDPITINYNASYVDPIINLDNQESPPVRIEHWEESY